MNINQAHAFIKEMAALADEKREKESKEQDAKGLGEQAAKCLRVLKDLPDSAERSHDLNRLITVLQKYGKKTKSETVFASILAEALEEIKPPLLPRELVGLIEGYVECPRTAHEFLDFERRLSSERLSPDNLFQLCKQIAAKWIDKKEVEACTNAQAVIDLIKEEIAHDLIAICPRFEGGDEFLKGLGGLSRIEQAARIEKWLESRASEERVEDMNLNFSKLGLRHLPPVVCLLNTSGLDIRSNRLRELPPEIEHMQLFWFHAEDNQLTHLPKLCEHIATLWINNNQFTEFPRTLLTTNPHELHVSENPFTEFPPEIALMKLNNVKCDTKQKKQLEEQFAGRPPFRVEVDEGPRDPSRPSWG